MPKVKKRLQRAQKLSFCPDCGKRFANETNVLQHMNQPSNPCGSLINNSWTDFLNIPTQEAIQSPHWPQTVHPASPTNIPDELHYQGPDVFDLRSDRSYPQSSNPPMPSDSFSNVELYPGASQAFPGGKTFMDDFFSDKHRSLHKDNLFYPFASQEDWQLGSWLLQSGVSMAGIDNFLKLDLVSIYNIAWLLSSNGWPDKDTRNLVPVCKATVSMHQDVTIRSSLEISSNLSASPNKARCEPLLSRPHWLPSGRWQYSLPLSYCCQNLGRHLCNMLETPPGRLCPFP